MLHRRHTPRQRRERVPRIVTHTVTLCIPIFSANKRRIDRLRSFCSSDYTHHKHTDTDIHTNTAEHNSTLLCERTTHLRSCFSPTSTLPQSRLRFVSQNLSHCITLDGSTVRYDHRYTMHYLFVCIVESLVPRGQHPLNWTTFQLFLGSVWELRVSWCLCLWLNVESERRKGSGGKLIGQLCREKEISMKGCRKRS